MHKIIDIIQIYCLAYLDNRNTSKALSTKVFNSVKSSVTHFNMWKQALKLGNDRTPLKLYNQHEINGQITEFIEASYILADTLQHRPTINKR